MTIGDVTFTSLTGTLSIYNITASGTCSAAGTEVAHNTLFPGAEPDSAISKSRLPETDPILGYETCPLERPAGVPNPLPRLVARTQ